MDLQKLKAKDLMTKRVVSIHFETSLQETLETLSEEKISGAPVVDQEGKPIGVISLTDIASYEVNKAPKPTSGQTSFYSIPETEGLVGIEDVEETGQLDEMLSTVPVVRAMTPTIFSVAPATPIPQVAGRMVQERVHRILVTDKGKIVGLVSSLDILKAIAKAAKKPSKK